MITTPHPLIQLEGLTKHFPLRSGLLSRSRQFVHAVDGVDLTIARGERIGLIGSAGAGKSIMGKLLARLIDPSVGTIVLHDGDQRIDATYLRGQQLKPYWQHVQMLFPHARESLDPHYTVFDTVAEPLHSLTLARSGLGNPFRATTEDVADMLQWVGLEPAQDFLFRYPHALSDAQIQRVTLARAFITTPALIVADDPFALLDAPLRTLLRVLQHTHTSLVYLTRDPATARYLCERIGVMLRGKLVELGATESVLQTPAHPYTRAWLSAQSHVDLHPSRETALLDNMPIHSIEPHPRCRFYGHCSFAHDICRDTPHPPLEDKGNGHHVACYHAGA